MQESFERCFLCLAGAYMWVHDLVALIAGLRYLITGFEDRRAYICPFFSLSLFSFFLSLFFSHILSCAYASFAFAYVSSDDLHEVNFYLVPSRLFVYNIYVYTIASRYTQYNEEMGAGIENELGLYRIHLRELIFDRRG